MKMQTSSHHKKIVFSSLIIISIGTLYLGWNLFNTNHSTALPSTVVDQGLVERTISVSGVIQSDSTASLTFPLTGTIESVIVNEGDTVTANQALVRLRTLSIEQELQEARASLVEAMAQQRELLSGVTSETRDVTDTLVRNAEQQLTRITSEQRQAIQNARQILLSPDLVAFPKDTQERTTAPTISGTYRCEAEGEYTLTVFRSAAESGFSIRVTGLETDTVPMSFIQAVPFGTCGLRVQFTESVLYNNTVWKIAIPNTASPQYTTNRNQYESVVLAAQNAITKAEEAVTLATQQRNRDIAPTRSEQIAQADARIAQIEARIQRIQTRLDEHTLRAPFAGVVTNIDAVQGEIVGNTPIITLLGATDAYELRVRVPEIDITNLAVGQTARAIFDARRSEPQTGSISYISPLSVQVDGVAYFEATIQLDNQTDWLRSGLNADIDLVIEEREHALRVPTSFLIQEGEATFVRTSQQNGLLTPVSIILRGTNGFTAISEITEGTVIFSP